MEKNNYVKELMGQKGIVLFDGYCNLCSWSVQFIIKRDVKDYFRFASLQSEVAKKLIKEFNIPSGFDKSVVLVENNAVFFKSGAALRIARKLRHGWPAVYAFIIIPKLIRNAIYDFIANNRFKWFGRKKECYVPKVDLSYKFL